MESSNSIGTPVPPNGSGGVLFGAAGQSAANMAVALSLGAVGIPVFPARVARNAQAGKWVKRPSIKGWRTEATTSAAQIERWWRGRSDAVPGIELGSAGLVVIDCDRHGGPDGVVAFADLVSVHGVLLPHPITLTPGNGEHHIFRQSNDLRLGNSRSGLGNVIHVDVAFPLDRDASIKNVQLLVETKKRF